MLLLMPPLRGTAGDGGCYTIPMRLCYGGGFWALTIALAGLLPGDCFPLEGPGVMDLHGELAVAEGPLWGGQLTADRDRCSLKVRGHGRGSVERGGEASL